MEKLEQKVYAIKEQAKDAANVATAKTKKSADKVKEKAQEKTRTLMEYKLEELTKRVNEHNNLIKRTYALEEKMSVHEEQIKVANHRIEDLERKGE